ncbi:hypothetical protein V2J09_011461, partial [Rumex salicifolius]
FPHAIITEHSPQFESTPFKKYCKSINIQLRFASVSHPQTNSQVENVNARLLDDIRRRAFGSKGKWMKCFLRTTPRYTTGVSPFQMVYGMDVVVPIEVLAPSNKVQNFDQSLNEESMLIAMYLRDEMRAKAALKEKEFKRCTRLYHDRNAKVRPLIPGVLVLRRTEGGKFDPKWEGPFLPCMEVVPGDFKLCEQNDSLAQDPERDGP